MKDGAHTHHDHSGGSGLWLAVVIGLVLAASSGAIASAVSELVHLLVMVLAVTAGLAITTGLVVMIRHRRPRQRIVARSSVPVPAPDQSRPEIAVLRAELASLRRQVAAVTAPADLSSLDSWLPESDPLAVEAGRPGRDDS